MGFQIGTGRLAALSTLILMGCAGSGATDPPATASVTAELGVEFELEVGETARVADESLYLTLLGVTEDSRCPIDVVCVWQGNARVVLEARQSEMGPSTQVILNTGLQPTELEVHGVTVRLMGVLPAAHSDRTIPPGDYSALLLVTR